MLLFLLLEPDVFLNHLAVLPYRVHTVVLCPEMIAPMGRFFRNGKLLNSLIAVRPFRIPINSDWRYLDQQMYVVSLNVQLNHHAPQLLTKYHDAFVHLSTYRPLQYPVSTLGTIQDDIDNAR